MKKIELRSSYFTPQGFPDQFNVITSLITRFRQLMKRNCEKKLECVYKQKVIYAGKHTMLSFITRFLG